MTKVKTKIDWCDYTINCFWGCRKGCSYCVSRGMAKRFSKRIGVARNYSQEIIDNMVKFNPVYLHDQLENIYKIKKPSRIFMSMMGEPFSNEFDQFIPEVMNVIKDNPQHTIIMLTKRPENLPKWSPFPDNCWIGVSATDDNMYAMGYFYLANFVEAKIKFLSVEPLLSSISIGHISSSMKHINWIVIGQQTPVRKKTMPEVRLIKDIVQEADRVDIPVFLKNNLEELLYGERFNPDHLLYWRDGYYTSGGHPEVDIRLRQEYPK